MFAAGSEARSLPGVEFDGKVVLGNREILSLPEVPKSLVVVGAGAVGVEFASIFQSFGTTVTILEMLPRMVPLEDEEISAELEKAFRKRGIQIFTEAKVESVKKDAEGATVAFRDKSGQAQTVCGRASADGRGARPAHRAIWVWTRRGPRSSADSCTSGHSWRPTSRTCTPSAISLRACRNWRTPLPWKASSRSEKSPASRCGRWSARAFPTPPTASRRSARSG